MDTLTQNKVMFIQHTEHSQEQGNSADETQATRIHVTSQEQQLNIFFL